MSRPDPVASHRSSAKISPRVVVTGDIYSNACWKEALGQAREICRANPAIREVVLVLEKQSVWKTFAFRNFLGKRDWEAIKRSAWVKLDDGRRLPIRHETMRALEWLREPSLVIACWAGKRMLEHIEGPIAIAAAVIIPLDPAITEAIKPQPRAPKTEGAKAKAEKPQFRFADPVLEQAFLELTREVNLAEGFAISYHREAAETVLRVLRIFGHKADASLIREWAVSKGWRMQDAEILAALARKILGRKAMPQTPRAMEAYDRYLRWANAAIET